ncbi:HEAT repeat domain-containing protein [Lentzea sp. JNUCC 0626]|uniref:HEAT repeat domain-containing protein n=1 Tax=Lentzea sp. JNUCC 0626 TaxID=3367513 RepID=UPI0037483C2D
MGIGRARRIARRAHRGQLTHGGGLFLDELEQVVRRVEENGGGRLAVQAAWLHAAPAAGVNLDSEGVSLRVRQVVKGLRAGPGWTRPESPRVARACELVRAAIVAQWRVVAQAQEDDTPALPLAELLDRYRVKPGPEVRGAIYALVGELDGPATPVVAELVERWWDSDDWWEPMIAVRAAHRVGLLDRERLLRKVVEGPSSAAGAAIQALDGPGDEAEVAALRAVLRRPEPEWRSVRGSARRRLSEIGGPAAEESSQDWYFSPMDVPWRYDMRWLRRNGASVLARLIEALNDPAWQYEAPQALGVMKAVEAVGPLCALAPTLPDPTPFIRALGVIGDPAAGPVLAEFTRHAKAGMRELAVQALGQTGGADVTAVALAACDDPDVHVRYRAARVLAAHGDERAVTTLIRLCDTEHAAVAADALARIADPRAESTFWHLFNHHPDRAARHAAGRGLARIECDEQWPRPEPVIERAYMWLLGHKPEWSRFYLETGTQNADAMVRVRAVEAFARLRDPGGIPHIRPLLTDPDARVRAAARNVLKFLEGIA